MQQGVWFEALTGGRNCSPARALPWMITQAATLLCSALLSAQSTAVGAAMLNQ